MSWRFVRLIQKLRCRPSFWLVLLVKKRYQPRIREAKHFISFLHLCYDINDFVGIPFAPSQGGRWVGKESEAKVTETCVLWETHLDLISVSLCLSQLRNLLPHWLPHFWHTIKSCPFCLLSSCRHCLLSPSSPHLHHTLSSVISCWSHRSTNTVWTGLSIFTLASNDWFSGLKHELVFQNTILSCQPCTYNPIKSILYLKPFDGILFSLDEDSNP